ncbi:MAG: protein of unknown function [Nitrospira sp.]
MSMTKRVRRLITAVPGSGRALVTGVSCGILCGLAVWLQPAIASAATSAQDPKHFVLDVITISGEEFVVKDEAGTEAKIHVGTDTEKFGHVQPGDRIDAWVLPNGHAKTIMILRSAAFMRSEQDRGQGQGIAPEPGTGSVPR